MTDAAVGRRVVRRTVLLGAAATLTANAIGVIVVVVLLTVVLPLPPLLDEAGTRATNIVWAAIYAGSAGVIGLIWSVRDARQRLGWLRRGDTPNRRERRRTVRVPLAASVRQLILWFLGAWFFALLNAGQSVLLGVEVGLTVLVGGLVTTSTSFLLIQRVGRAVVAEAYAGRSLTRPLGAGVAWRTVLTWGLSTGLPLAGLALLGGLSLTLDISQRELAVATLVLALTALAAGLATITILARSIADPLREVRRALAGIEAGDMDVVVPVTDTTEVGVLQAGVNRMVEGLRERDEVRDLFGRHVGHDVALKAIADGVRLGGEEREVAALFVDVVDSTGLAQRLPPAEVLAILNGFFGVIVEVVDAHGGVVNKFMGDAALAVWGAPLAHDDPATAALAAARELGRRLPGDAPRVHAGVGVGWGRVVAGNLGATDRLEYTVIGDPVNVAARLSARAKDHDPSVLTDMAAVDAADEVERDHWASLGPVTLRGRTSPTVPARPVSGGDDLGDGPAE